MSGPILRLYVFDKYGLYYFDPNLEIQHFS